MSNTIRKLDHENLEQIVEVFSAAFFNYPVMRYVLQDSTDYSQNLRTLIRFFTIARVLRRETIFGAFNNSELIGVATTSNPDRILKIPEMQQWRDKTWLILGQEAKTRYEKLGQVWADLDAGIPNVHLNMLAVLPNTQGSGAGRRLLEEVHELSRTEAYSRGVSLTTEDPANISLYEYMGYKITGHFQLDEGLQTWNFFRPDQS